MDRLRRCRGTRGYAENAAELISRYESLTFPQKHQALLELVPGRCSRVLDVGAGTGGDAGWLAERGHEVVAVEPTAEFRNYASTRYPSRRIEWVDDCLPDLAAVVGRRQSFGLIVVSAVWMHLDREERAAAMRVLESLLSPGGLLYISLRHGPIPDGRTMFDVTPAETVADGEASGLEVVLNRCEASAQAMNRQAGITWSQLAFLKPNDR